MRVINADKLAEWYFGSNANLYDVIGKYAIEIPDPVPPHRLAWTRRSDGTLKSDKIGEAWFTFDPLSGMMYLHLSDGRVSFGGYDTNVEAMQDAEEAAADLGLAPAPPDPWTPPVIRDEPRPRCPHDDVYFGKPDPVKEICRVAKNRDVTLDGVPVVKTLLARIDALEAALRENDNA